MIKPYRGFNLRSQCWRPDHHMTLIRDCNGSNNELLTFTDCYAFSYAFFSRLSPHRCFL